MLFLQLFYQWKVFTMERNMGIPKVMLKGKVIANAMGKYKPGFALGTAIFMVAGTAI